MVLSLIRRLSEARPEPFDKDASQQALAALMVRLARTDGHYDLAEAAMITDILMERFALDRQSAEDLRSTAEEVEAEAPDTVRFTRQIKDAVAYEDREAVIEALWLVVLADGHRDNDENSLMRLVVNLLGVNDRNSALARQRAEARRL